MVTPGRSNQELELPRAASIRASTPTAPYSRRPPSPPYIAIPLAPRSEAGLYAYTVIPSEKNLAAIRCTKEQVDIITRDKAQMAKDFAATWNYEQRRDAQPILDYISIGPVSIVRNHDWVRQHNVTMVVVVRDARMAATRLLSVDKASEACAFEYYYVNVESWFRLIHDLPEIIHNLNSHMLRVHNTPLPHGSPPDAPPRVGNILVTCDTGNDRSAAIVAAYIMAMFSTTMFKAVQFISIQRFCCTFDEEIKRMLQTWEDILRAKAFVSAHADNATTQATSQIRNSKRGVDDMMAVDCDMDDGGVRLDSDVDRFVGRETFVPFMDTE